MDFRESGTVEYCHASFLVVSVTHNSVCDISYCLIHNIICFIFFQFMQLDISRSMFFMVGHFQMVPRLHNPEPRARQSIIGGSLLLEIRNPIYRYICGNLKYSEACQF